MSAELLRFLHASDFRLEQPISGLGEAPNSLRKLLIEAPFASAQRVFDAALAEGVRFVVLSGNLLDLHACEPRSITFLLEQFERLAQHQIDVYWAGGPSDSPANWPAAVSLPTNVHCFGMNTLEECLIEIEGGATASIIGVSQSAKGERGSHQWSSQSESLLTIAVANGTFDATQLANVDVDYWALGGKPNYDVVCPRDPTAVYAGSPQGRCPQDTGEHGCRIVQVLESGEYSTRVVATESARFRQIQMRSPKDVSREKLEDLLGEQLLNLASEAIECVTLVSVVVESGTGPGNDKLSRQLANWARKEFGGSATELFVCDVRFQSPKDYPTSWREEDSILGDFLRTVPEDGGQGEIDFARYLPTGVGEAVRKLVDTRGVDAEPFTREAAKLGVDLLRGEDAA